MLRIGNGYDVHKFAKNRRLVLGGVEIDYPIGLDGHSDADVLFHAIVDALLGAAALGDIGGHFPPSDERYRGADSGVLLAEVTRLLSEHGYSIGNIDTVIVAEKPKLAEYIPQMRKNAAAICGVAENAVSIKATTEEGLGLAGRGIAAHCVCTIFLQKD